MHRTRTLFWYFNNQDPSNNILSLIDSLTNRIQK